MKYFSILKMARKRTACRLHKSYARNSVLAQNSTVMFQYNLKMYKMDNSRCPTLLLSHLTLSKANTQFS